jgi:hypothetical protein
MTSPDTVPDRHAQFLLCEAGLTLTMIISSLPGTAPASSIAGLLKLQVYVYTK